MSWKQVIVIGIFVAGAVTAHALGGEGLGNVLAGAAAGFAVNREPSRP